MRATWSLALAAVAAGALGACATSPAPNPSSPADLAAQRGHDFARVRCSGCHEIGLDEGGAAEGPPFRTLAARYNALSLQRRFAEVSAHGFDRMPPTSFTASQAGDLIAYLGTLRAH